MIDDIENKKNQEERTPESNHVSEAIEKQALLDEIRKNVNETGDGLGKPIDSGIKETVVFLNALGITTTGSCEGHIKEGLPWPWIDTEDPNQPEEQFEDQNKIFQNIAERNGLKVEKLKKGEPIKIWFEAIRAASKNSESKEYKDWTEKNKKVVEKVKKLLESFYKDRNVDEMNKLVMKDTRLGFETGLGDTNVLDLEATERDKLDEALPARKNEMRAFTKFLENKYWEM